MVEQKVRSLSRKVSAKIKKSPDIDESEKALKFYLIDLNKSRLGLIEKMGD